MAVTNNVLNAINVFSSTSVFNSNKSSVGANDLNFIKQTTAELATEGGGIIAQSLGTNGYVKFANGLILQWGKVQQKSGNLFPIKFPSTCYGTWSSEQHSNNVEGNTFAFDNVSTAGFTCYNIDRPKYYIALGKQQWGRNGASFHGTIVYNFPIAFTTEMMWVSNSHNTSSTNNSPWACGGWGGTLTSVSVYSNGTDVSYIAIGR